MRIAREARSLDRPLENFSIPRGTCKVGQTEKNERLVEQPLLGTGSLAVPCRHMEPTIYIVVPHVFQQELQPSSAMAMSASSSSTSYRARSRRSFALAWRTPSRSRRPDLVGPSTSGSCHTHRRSSDGPRTEGAIPQGARGTFRAVAKGLFERACADAGSGASRPQHDPRCACSSVGTPQCAGQRDACRTLVGGFQDPLERIGGSATNAGRRQGAEAGHSRLTSRATRSSISSAASS
jgi:hypothetical protein